jgi:hypothetical protein
VQCNITTVISFFYRRSLCSKQECPGVHSIMLYKAFEEKQYYFKLTLLYWTEDRWKFLPQVCIFCTAYLLCAFISPQTANYKRNLKIHTSKLTLLHYFWCSLFDDIRKCIDRPDNLKLFAIRNRKTSSESGIVLQNCSSCNGTLSSLSLSLSLLEQTEPSTLLIQAGHWTSC